MSDANDRLAALDPAAHQPYHHPDLDSMIARIVTEHHDTRAARRQRFQARLAGGLIGATLVTALSFALMQSAPSLPALALRTASSANAGTATAVRSAAPMLARDDIHFHPGPDISRASPSRASYELRIAKNDTEETEHLGAVFGVAGTATMIGPRTWSVSDSAGAVLDYESEDVPRWHYSSPRVAPATESTSTSVGVVNHATLEADAQSYLVALGFNYAVSSPRFSTTSTLTTSARGASHAVKTSEVTYVVDVHGIATDQTVSFTVDSANELLAARGPAFNVSHALRYPLRSPRAAVAALNSYEHHSFASASTTPPRVTATITSDELSLASYELTNGTTWLLPVYTYTSTIHRGESGLSKSMWTVVALKPAYVVGPLVTSGAGG